MKNMKNTFKTVMLALVLAVSMTFTSNVTAQNVKYQYPYVEEYAWSFSLPVGGFPEIGESGYIYIESDSSGHTWLKYNVLDANVVEYVDKQGRRTFGRYAVYTGKHIYLKLDNDEIITLTCSYMIQRPDGYEYGTNDIYVKYAIYSYFDINETILGKLLSHNIIKMRVECRYDVIDATFKGYNPEFAKNYNTFMNKYLDKKQKDNLQTQVNNNPLLGF